MTIAHAKKSRRKAFSYARFSTSDQIKGDSFRRQMAMTEDYAWTHDLDLDTSLSFHDVGVSAFRGRNAETGQLAAMLEAIGCGLIKKGSVILVESLDRISRQSARKALRIIEDIVESDVSVITIYDGREYTADLLDQDPLSLLIALLTFIRANEESQMKSQRISAAWVAKRSNANKIPLTARCPGWLKLSKDKMTFQQVPRHVKTVKWIVKQALNGRSLISIVRELNKRNIDVPSNGRIAVRWYVCNIRRLLCHEALIGDMTPHKIEYDQLKKVRVPLTTIKGYYPAIITRTEFRKLKTFAAKRLTALNSKRSLQIHNILAHLGRCGSCGYAIAFCNKSERATYLICRTAYDGAGCEVKPIRYWEIELGLIRSLQDVLLQATDELDSLQINYAKSLALALREEPLDRTAINYFLKMLFSEVLIYPNYGKIKLMFHSGQKITIKNVFTPSDKRQWGDRIKMMKAMKAMKAQ